MIVGGWLPGRPGADKEPRARDKMWADLRGAENSCWGHRGHRRLCSSQHRALLTFTLVNTICLWLNMKRCGKVCSRIKCNHVRNIYPVTSRMWVDIYLFCVELWKYFQFWMRHASALLYEIARKRVGWQIDCGGDDLVVRGVWRWWSHRHAAAAFFCRPATICCYSLRAIYSRNITPRHKIFLYLLNIFGWGVRVVVCR